MKKLISLVLTAALGLTAAFSLTACGENNITIAIPNDTTNEARALLLLEDLGFITLKDNAGITATPLAPSLAAGTGVWWLASSGSWSAQGLLSQ